MVSFSLLMASAVLGAECPKTQTTPQVSYVVSSPFRISRSDGCPGYDWSSQTSGFAPQQQSHTVKIPLSPRINNAVTAITSAAGMIGITLTGVPIYAPNDNAGRDVLAPAYSVYGSGQLQCGDTLLTQVQGVTSAFNCAVSCKKNKNCGHFTFWSTGKRCNLFATCSLLVGGGVDAQTYKIDQNEGDQNDQCAGHSSSTGVYHYRSMPGDMHAMDNFQSNVGDISYCPGLEDSMKDAATGEHSPLVGFALDGIPIFGPRTVGGKLPTDLDECNGHTSSLYPFYHYHMSTSYPYTIGCFRGCVCDAADYADATDCPNTEFAGGTCTPLVPGYDYSALVGVAAASTAAYGQTKTTVAVDASTPVAAAGSESAGVQQVSIADLNLAAGATPEMAAEAWAKKIITQAGYTVTVDSSKGSNLVAYLEPGQSYGRVIVTQGGYKTGYALSLVVANGKVWGQFEKNVNVLKLYFAENNKYIVAKFV